MEVRRWRLFERYCIHLCNFVFKKEINEEVEIIQSKTVSWGQLSENATLEDYS